MWYKVLLTCAAVLCVTGIAADTTTARPINLDEGETLPLSIQISEPIKGCYLDTPDGSTIEIKPEKTAEERYQLRSNPVSPCAVEVNNLSASDNGVWKLYYTDDSGNVITESSFELTVESNVEDIPTPEGPPLVSIEEGHTLHTLVPTTGNVFGCYLETPGQAVIEFKPQNRGDSRFELREDNHVTKCSVDVKNVQDTDNGVWTIYYTDETSDVLGKISYNITVTKPVTDDSKEREIEMMPAKKFDTNLGARLQVEIPKESSFFLVESCHLKTPLGAEYKLDQYVTIPSIEVVTATDSCKVFINVTSEEEVGEWTLIAKATRFTSDFIEKRLPVTIYVEESVKALPQSVIISKGKNLYIRLESPTNMYKTCKLIAPKNANITYEYDSRNTETCGYIVKNIDESLAGTWSIVYDNKIVYRAQFHVTIGNSWSGPPETLTWYAGRNIDQVLGPDDTVFCKIVNPKGVTILDGADKCRIALDSVSEDDAGTWTMVVGLNGRVLTDLYTFQVYVKQIPQLEVRTSVQDMQPSIILTCFVSSEYEVRTCKFQMPTGQILMVNEGVGEDKYVSQKNSSAVTSLKSKIHGHDCGIHILNPQAEDIGIWRCDVGTTHGLYYGFLSVNTPWLQPSSDTISQKSGPILKAASANISAVEGDTVVLSCSIQTAIRYCYFRYTNGSIFNVSPDSDQYVGAGLQAGECGLKIPAALPGDSGSWTCNVGLYNNTQAGIEQQDSIQLHIAEALTFKSEVESSDLVIEASTRNKASMDYCRFVRMDGKGFTSENVPAGYAIQSDLNIGVCKLRIPNASMLELHPWSVAVRIQGQQQEIVTVTPFLAEIPDNGGGNNTDVIYVWIKRNNTTAFSMCVMGIVLILVGVLFTPKKNREWVFARGSTVRTSVQRAFTRAPQQAPPIPEKISV